MKYFLVIYTVILLFLAHCNDTTILMLPKGTTTTPNDSTAIEDSTATNDSAPSTPMYSPPNTDTCLTKLNSGLSAMSIHSSHPLNSIAKGTWVEAMANVVYRSKSNAATFFQFPLKIKGRGNTTWEYPKKPYAIKLSDKQSLYGLPKDKDWVLLANFRDRTQLRNEVAFEISRRTDLAWTPRTDYIDLFYNRTYVGVYQICESIEISKEKINVGDGGYLFELDDKFDSEMKFRTIVRNLPIMIKEPDINTKQLQTIQSYFDSVETVLYSDNFKEEYAKLIDINSFIDWYLVHEIMQNSEPNHPKSVYMSKTRNGKLVMGPVWDFDWFIDFQTENFSLNESIWYERLFQDPYFVATLKSRWAILKDKLSDLDEFIDQRSSYLYDSKLLDDDIWYDELNHWGLLVDDHQALVSRLKTYFNDRIKWLDNAIGNLN